MTLDKALAGLNGTNSAALIAGFLLFVQPMQEEIDALHEQGDNHALQCYVDKKHFESLAAVKTEAADDAHNVYDRYRIMSEFQELSQVNRNRMIEKQEEETRLRAEAQAYTNSANLVCQGPNNAL